MKASKAKIKNKAIWLFAGGAMQEIVAKKIIERGFKFILTDLNPHCRCIKYADEFVPLDTFDIDGNVAAAQKLKKKYLIQAVFTSASDCHETVAHVSRTLGLHGISPLISHQCRYKWEMRKCLQEAGISQLLFGKAKNIDEARSIIRSIGLPAVIKSSNNSASRGFAKIERESDLTEEVFASALENGTAGYVLLEKLLVPVEDEVAEQSVETLWYNGKMYWLNWVDRLFRKDFLLYEGLKKSKFYSKVPWSVEIGHVNPALHDSSIKEKIFKMIYVAGLALGMGREKGGHILKADIMLTPQGPYILELTPRLSGGWDSSMTTPARGADFVGGAISLALGEKLDLDMWQKYFQYKNPNLFTAILALIDSKAKDCIGRKFSYGESFSPEESLVGAYKKVQNREFIV